MKKNIIIIFVACGLILAVYIVARWSTGALSVNKKVTPPNAAVNTADRESAFIKKAKELLESGKRADAIKILEEAVTSGKGSRQAYESLFMLADIYTNDNNLTKAKEAYLAITKEYSAYCDYADMQKRLSAINIAIIFSPVLTPDSEIYTVVPGDSLTKIAKKYSTTVELIKKANGLTNNIIRPQMGLKVQKAPFSIIVDKSQSSLTLVLGDEVIKTYTVATGRNNSTPVGAFKIKDKLVNPVWYSTRAVIPPDSPDNILGSRWMGLTTPKPGYGIHGTTDPKSIGYQSTDGCIRMHNSEVEELFAIVPVGTDVTILD